MGSKGLTKGRATHHSLGQQVKKYDCISVVLFLAVVRKRQNVLERLDGGGRMMQQLEQVIC